MAVCHWLGKMQLLYMDTYPVSGNVYLPSEVIVAACRLSFHKYTCLQYMQPVYLHYIRSCRRRKSMHIRLIQCCLNNNIISGLIKDCWLCRALNFFYFFIFLQWLMLYQSVISHYQTLIMGCQGCAKPKLLSFGTDSVINSVIIPKSIFINHNISVIKSPVNECWWFWPMLSIY